MMLTIYYQTSLWVHTKATLFGYPGLYFVLALWTGAWILQFIGHGVFEGRAPALLDSLDQVLS